MALKYSTALRNARLDAITTIVGSNPRLKIYDGTPPATCDAALSGNTLLVDMPCSAALAAAAASGVLTLNAITDTTIAATGTPAFYRLTTSGGTAHIQGTVSTSGADLNVSASPLVASALHSVTSYTITEGNA